MASRTGMVVGDSLNILRPPPKPTYNFTPQSAYSASIPQTADDYDSIMGKYRDLYSSAMRPQGSQDIGMLRNKYQNLLSSPGYQYQSYTPEKLAYKPTGDVTSAMSQLKELGETGGYSLADQAAIRERGISPIRSIYANAQRNMNRQKNLQGGYAPGFGAAATRMAREQSELIANQVTNVNAQLAEAIARGKLTAAPQYANLASTESGRGFDADRLNVTNSANAAQMNAQGQLQAATLRSQEIQQALAGLQSLQDSDRRGQSEALAAVEGMRGLYGTTPALAATFGAQTANPNLTSLPSRPVTGPSMTPARPTYAQPTPLQRLGDGVRAGVRRY